MLKNSVLISTETVNLNKTSDCLYRSREPAWLLYLKYNPLFFYMHREDPCNSHSTWRTHFPLKMSFIVLTCRLRSRFQVSAGRRIHWVSCTTNGEWGTPSRNFREVSFLILGWNCQTLRILLTNGQMFLLKWTLLSNFQGIIIFPESIPQISYWKLTSRRLWFGFSNICSDKPHSHSSGDTYPINCRHKLRCECIIELKSGS